MLVFSAAVAWGRLSELLTVAEQVGGRLELDVASAPRALSAPRSPTTQESLG